jgi:transposase
MSDTELLHKSEPVRRVEFFTGAGRRRRWSTEQKAGIIAESYADGETVCAVARRHGLTPQQLFGWRRAARRRAQESGVAFAPVLVGLGDTVPDQPRATGWRGAPAIEVAIGAVMVRVPAGVDIGTLQAVLGAVKALA